MMRWKKQIPLSLLLLVAAMLLLLNRAEAQMGGTPQPTTEAEASWLILPEMPEGATHANYGAEIYRLVCRDCHGGVGQGLTDEWRAEAFAPEDQNCWQSKCHNGTHPVDGFVLPKYIPPIAGEDSLNSFNSALDLYNYIRVAMPYHNRGSLLDIEYLQLTAFISELNGIETVPAEMDENVAASIVLRPHEIAPTPVATDVQNLALVDEKPLNITAVTLIITSAIVLALVIWQIYRR